MRKHTNFVARKNTHIMSYYGILLHTENITFGFVLTNSNLLNPINLNMLERIQM